MWLIHAPVARVKIVLEYQFADVSAFALIGAITGPRLSRNFRIQVVLAIVIRFLAAGRALGSAKPLILRRKQPVKDLVHGAAKAGQLPVQAGNVRAVTAC